MKRFSQLTQTATETDLVAGNFLAIDIPGVGGATKKLPGNCVAPKSIQDDAASVYKYTEISATSSVDGKYVNASGSEVSFATYNYKKFAVSSDTAYFFSTAFSGDSVYALIELNSSNVVVATHYKGGNGVSSNFDKCKITTKSTTAYIVINAQTAYGWTPQLFTAVLVSVTNPRNVMNALVRKEDDKIETELSAVGDRIDAVDALLDDAAAIYKYTEISATSSVDGKYVNASGSEVSFATYNYKKFAVSSDTAYFFSTAFSGDSVYALIELNSSNVVVATHYKGGNGVSSNFDKCKITTKSTTAYIVINAQTAYGWTPQLFTAVLVSVTNPRNVMNALVRKEGDGVRSLEAVISDAASNYNYTEITSTGGGDGVIRSNGTTMAVSGFHYKNYDVSPNTEYCFTTTYTGNVVYGIIEFNAGNAVVATRWLADNGAAGRRTFEKCPFKTTATTTHIAINSQGDVEVALFTRAKAYETTIQNFVLTTIKQKFDEIKDPITGKKLVWFGTSIPAAGYPQIVGSILGANVINEAVASSMVRSGRFDHSEDPLDDNYMGVNGVNYQNVLLSLSLSQEEKKYIMECWKTDDRKAKLISEGYSAEQVADVKGFVRILGGSYYNYPNDPTEEVGGEPIDMMDAANVNKRKSYYATSWNSSVDIEAGFGSISGKIEKYMTADAAPDYWVFDHGHNDGLSYDTDAQLEDVPADVNNRYSFVGALDYIIGKILSFDPRAKILVIGHYTNQVGGTNRPVQVCKGQENFARKWQLHFCKTWEKLPFSQSVVVTNGYWDGSGVWHNTGFNGSNHTGGNLTPGFNQNPRQVDGVWVHDMTMKQIYLKDDLHPYSDPTKKLYADVLSAWITSVL